jgi:DeoR/GlpR family transcriptional regulator of sugar metabolism
LQYAACVPEAKPDPPVFAAERQERLARVVAARGRARIGELAQEFGVTEPTIRKDLTVLQERGALKRTHGGAIALRPPIERELSDRTTTLRAAKSSIGKACSAMIGDGDSVFLDSGTTVAAVARALAAQAPASARNIAVLTNAVDVASTLADVPDIEHLLIGGELRRASGSLVGAVALRSLQGYVVDIAFVSASGISEAGVTVASAAEAEIKSAIVHSARRVVVAADHTKIGVTDFARITSLDEIDTLVTDLPTPEFAELCAAHEIELVTAPAE